MEIFLFFIMRSISMLGVVRDSAAGDPCSTSPQGVSEEGQALPIGGGDRRRGGHLLFRGAGYYLRPARPEWGGEDDDYQDALDAPGAVRRLGAGGRPRRCAPGTNGAAPARGCSGRRSGAVRQALCARQPRLLRESVWHAEGGYR